jgi:hypothetical protein
MPETFGHIDFKIVDNEPDNHMLKGLKVGLKDQGGSSPLMCPPRPSDIIHGFMDST